jgi:hypothetical protein
MSAMGQSNFQVNVIVNINTSDWTNQILFEHSAYLPLYLAKNKGRRKEY